MTSDTRDRARATGSVAALVVSAFLAVACDGADSVPKRLVDGSPAGIAALEFEGVDTPIIETRARVATPADLHDCELGTPGRRSIRRVGVSGESITTLSRRARTLRACDRTEGSAPCGVAHARLRDDVELDARLSLTCRDEEGRPIGFLWVVPGRDAAYAVVEGQGFVEAYPAIGRTPVRITTTSVDVESSTARATVSEHTRTGARLRTYVVDAQVAG